VRRGKCSYAGACKWSHSDEQVMAAWRCRAFATTLRCRFGDDCRNLHSIEDFKRITGLPRPVAPLAPPA
jgi:hypothetical protein